LKQSDSDEERDRLEKERIANLKKEEEADGKKSAISSSGANTPSGRKEKISGTASEREGVLKKSASSKSLKRPGSPNLSDASGTDVSSRKKKLKSRHLVSTQPTPQPSRPMSPANVSSSSGLPTLEPSSAATMKLGKKRGPGSGSDTDILSDRDGGVISDASRARRLKLKMSASPSATVTGGTGTPQPASRAGSPAPRSAPTPVAGPTAFPTVQDIKNAIPPHGIAIKDLMKVVAHPKERRAEFVTLVKEVARMDKERGVLMLK